MFYLQTTKCPILLKTTLVSMWVPFIPLGLRFCFDSSSIGRLRATQIDSLKTKINYKDEKGSFNELAGAGNSLS
jgi:hypothetical protein